MLYDIVRKLGRVTGDELQITNKGNLVIGRSTINIARQQVQAKLQELLDHQTQGLFRGNHFQPGPQEPACVFFFRIDANSISLLVVLVSPLLLKCRVNLCKQ